LINETTLYQVSFIKFIKNNLKYIFDLNFLLIILM